MGFPTGHLDDPKRAGAGETIGVDNISLTALTFENGLVAGRFAKLDTGSLDNIDASVAPVIAGVVLRKIEMPVEDGSAIDNTLYGSVEYLRQGVVTVDVMAADDPSALGPVFVKNTADADAGKATTVDDATTEAASGEFLHEVQAGVWAIRLY